VEGKRAGEDVCGGWVLTFSHFLQTILKIVGEEKVTNGWCDGGERKNVPGIFPPSVILSPTRSTSTRSARTKRDIYVECVTITICDC
jgi:hypothetical protein